MYRFISFSEKFAFIFIFLLPLVRSYLSEVTSYSEAYSLRASDVCLAVSQYSEIASSFFTNIIFYSNLLNNNTFYFFLLCSLYNLFIKFTSSIKHGND